MTAKKTTAKTAPSTGHTLTLNGETVALVPTAKAIMLISQGFGGLVPAIERVRAFDVNAIGSIVHVALGRTGATARDVEKTIAEICEGDLTEATSAVAGYLSTIMSGPAAGRGVSH